MVLTFETDYYSNEYSLAIRSDSDCFRFAPINEIHDIMCPIICYVLLKL